MLIAAAASECGCSCCSLLRKKAELTLTKCWVPYLSNYVVRTIADHELATELQPEAINNHNYNQQQWISKTAVILHGVVSKVFGHVHRHLLTHSVDVPSRSQSNVNLPKAGEATAFTEDQGQPIAQLFIYCIYTDIQKKQSQPQSQLSAKMPLRHRTPNLRVAVPYEHHEG